MEIRCHCIKLGKDSEGQIEEPSLEATWVLYLVNNCQNEHFKDFYLV